VCEGSRSSTRLSHEPIQVLCGMKSRNATFSATFAELEIGAGCDGGGRRAKMVKLDAVASPALMCNPRLRLGRALK
jgi:hypothetical protein